MAPGTSSGIRSDSDLHTFGCEFKSWLHESAIAVGPLSLDCLRETVAEHDLASRMRFRHRVVRVSWDSGRSRWTLTVERGDDTGGVETVTMTAS